MNAPHETNPFFEPKPQHVKLIDLAAAVDSPFFRQARSALLQPVETLLAVDKINRIYSRYHEKVDHCKAPREYFRLALKALRVDYHVMAADWRKIPRQGPLVVVANHPFGGIEGVILGAVLLQVRGDLRIMGNYLLRRITGIGDSIVPVDPFGNRSATVSNVKGLKTALGWVKSGGVLAVFPAGEVASFQMHRRQIADPAWSPHIAGIIRRARAAVLPVFFPGRNGPLFQLVGMIHPRLRSALLPRELVNKAGRRIPLHVGRVIPWPALKKFESDAALIDYLRLRTHFLKNRGGSAIHRLPLPAAPKKKVADPVPVIAPVAPGKLKAELAALPAEQKLDAGKEYSVFIAPAPQIPNILREIGRLREITFREANEGTGREIDRDRFDDHYLHLFLWNHVKGELVGAYRLGLTNVILERFGARGLYTNELFRFKPALLRRLNSAIEFGRSFIRLEYQKKFNSLMLLWKGIGTFVARNPQYNILFGPVSISNDYHTVSRNLMVRFLKAKRFDDSLSRFVCPRRPYRSRRIAGLSRHLLQSSETDIDDISLLVSEIEEDGKGIPVLLRQYLKLNGSLICFNVDPSFANVVDGLLMVDLRKTDPRLLKRFMGAEGVERFIACHGPLQRQRDDIRRRQPGQDGREAA